MRPSTKQFIREAKNASRYSFFDWLHGYVYARWPYFYIGVGTGEHWLARKMRPLVYWVGKLLAQRGREREVREEKKRTTFADTYHGKVVPPQAATQLVTMDKEIRLTDLEHVIPYPVARDIILQNPDHIVVLDCPCRMVRSNPCLPLDVCMIVGEPMAGFVAEHHPNRSRWITQEEAVDILKAEHERGHAHHAFFSRMRCWDASTRSATAAPAAVVRCRPNGTAFRCWRLQATPRASMKIFATNAEPARMHVRSV